MLTSLTVDHLLKAEGAPIELDARDIFDSLVSAETMEKHGALEGYLEGLPPIKLARLDTTTGILSLEVGEKERSFSGSVTVGEVDHRVGLELPARIEGGYWRTPGVLQVSFWKERRPTFSYRTEAGAEVELEVECIAVSTDGIRVVSATPGMVDVLVGFGPCE